MRWYSRSELLLGEAPLEAFASATVAVFGLGGVGSFAVEALARTGIGTLRLVDHDVVSGSNINRQLFALRGTLGQKKVDVATARVLDINPDCNVDGRNAFIRAETLPDLLEPRPDVVVDAIDSVSCKVALLKAARERGIPVVSSMGAGGRVDSSLLFAGDLSETRICPLAAVVRGHLRKAGITSGIRCVGSLEPADNKRPPNPLDAEAHRGPGRPRRALGTVSYMPGIVGLKVAEEVMRLLVPERLGPSKKTLGSEDEDPSKPLPKRPRPRKRP